MIKLKVSLLAENKWWCLLKHVFTINNYLIDSLHVSFNLFFVKVQKTTLFCDPRVQYCSEIFINLQMKVFQVVMNIFLKFCNQSNHHEILELYMYDHCDAATARYNWFFIANLLLNNNTMHRYIFKINLYMTSSTQKKKKKLRIVAF